MANRYVYSGAGGSGTGADWANAHTTLTAAISAGAAGDVYFVAHDHAETQASSLVLTFKGTAATPDRILCVNRAGSVPPVAADLTTGGSVTTTGASNIQIAGNFYCYGIAWNCGTGATSSELRPGASAGTQSYEACSFNLLTTATASRIACGNGSSAGVTWVNCTVSFGNASQGFRQDGGRLTWRGSPTSAVVTGATIPTALFTNAGLPAIFDIRGLDLSNVNTTIAGDQASPCSIQLVNCKLHASVTVSATPTVANRGGVDLIGCNSGSSIQRNERYRYMGVITTETTIVRSGGAADPNATAYSWKLAGNSNNEKDFPLDTEWRELWNNATGSAKTLTVHTVTDNVTLKDDECWLEVEYPGSSGSPVAYPISDGIATPLTAGANQSSSTETWTTTGLTTPVKQKLECTFTPQNAGPIRFRVRMGKASTTVYACPKAELS